MGWVKKPDATASFFGPHADEYYVLKSEDSEWEFQLCKYFGGGTFCQFGEQIYGTQMIEALHNALKASTDEDLRQYAIYTNLLMFSTVTFIFDEVSKQWIQINSHNFKMPSLDAFCWRPPRSFKP